MTIEVHINEVTNHVQFIKHDNETHPDKEWLSDPWGSVAQANANDELLLDWAKRVQAQIGTLANSPVRQAFFQLWLVESVAELMSESASSAFTESKVRMERLQAGDNPPPRKLKEPSGRLAYEITF